MVGGYATVSLMTASAGRPRTLPLAFVMAAVSIVLERTLYRRLYRLGPRPVPADHRLGSSRRRLRLVLHHRAAVDPGPAWLQGSQHVRGMSFASYRMFRSCRPRGPRRADPVPGKTRFGARVRAAWTTSAWRAAGHRRRRAFMFTFALGGGLAGLGRRASRSRSSASTRPSPRLPGVRYRGRGGRARLDRRLVRRGGGARHQRHGGEYYFPWRGAFLITCIVGLLMWRPQGCWKTLRHISSRSVAVTRWRSPSGSPRCCRSSCSRCTSCLPARSRSPRCSRSRSI